ncbi:GIP [Symbiodinium pilosum]|uniref:GIP protein n=1 Tax=Symbiodinium pilosum TaxID=2952 RepID=A0A812K6E5_SYMPI|nr:GIP [Symbiodinium pilosum]
MARLRGVTGTISGMKITIGRTGNPDGPDPGRVVMASTTTTTMTRTRVTSGSQTLGPLHGGRSKTSEEIGAAAAGENLDGAEIVVELIKFRRRMVELTFGDRPDRHREKPSVWNGWKHFTNSDWSDQSSHTSDESRRTGGGRPSEKLTVPSFSGEDSEDVGTSARSYLRQVEAWRRMTLLPSHQQGLVLYQHLTGKAWVAAEELSVDNLAKEAGVEYLVKWITNRYLDLEVTRIGKAFSEFFRRLRRKPGQTIRDYNSEYDRLHARLREEAAELNLVASVGNMYSLPRLQQAGVIHDRGHRKPWESGNSGKGRKPHTAHYTEADDSFDSGDDDGDGEDGEAGVSEEVAAAYATYQTAKQRYKEHQKNRGFNGYANEGKGETSQPGKGNEKTSEKIKLMKAKSFCSGCGRRGHWHKDAECPHNQPGHQKNGDKSSNKAADVGYCNLLPAEVFSIRLEDAGLLGITDTACARTVAGTQWLQAYTDKLATLGVRPELKKECEAYRFGTGKIYYSSFYVVLAFELGNKVAQVRTSIINGDVPLLLSKTVLGKLGMVFDIERGQADFNKVGLKGFDLLVTTSGHPAIPILPTKMDGDPGSFQAEDLKLVPKSQYMAFAVAHNPGHAKSRDLYNFFYDKKLEPGVKEMLVRERFPQDEFIAWWSSTSTTSDFWLECDHAWVRIHVTPRKVLFNPSTWKTRATVQKEMLVQTAGEIRVTDGICCTSNRWIESVVDRWEHDKLNEPAFAFHWEANRTGVIVHHTWGVTEIKACIMEARNAAKAADPTEQMKRVSHMSLPELRAKASELKIDYANTTTKGNLLRLIRDSLNTPDQELMKIGKFKGCQFCEILKSYGEWVVRELAQADSPDPELVRHGRWFNNKQRNPETRGYLGDQVAPPYPSSTAATRGPESIAASTTPSARESWSLVSDKASAPSTTSTRRRTRTEADEIKKMEEEMDPKVAAEIQDLETKLAILKDKAKASSGK